MAVCLLKPVKPSDLLLAIRKILGKPQLEARLVAPSNPQLPAAIRLDILVAEDNEINQKLAVAVLKKAGHRVSLAMNGLEAVAQWKQGNFDLILMDVQMPEMDGLEATRQIRQLEQGTGQRVAIVATTAHAMTGDRERCLESGMDEYLSKPLDRQGLLAMVARQGAQRSQTMPVPLTLGGEIFDPAEMLERLGGDPDLLRELVVMFLADSGTLQQGVSDAIDRQIAVSLEEAAHKMKGTVSIFGSRGAVQAAQELETMGREHDLTNAAETLTQLKAHVQALEKALHLLQQASAQTPA